MTSLRHPAPGRRKKNALHRKYSGHASRPFWNAVNGIKDAEKRHRLYGLGCVLQSIESHVLDELKEIK